MTDRIVHDHADHNRYADRLDRGRTYLYIRTHPDDQGIGPLDPSVPAWHSPDIVVVRADGSRGTEATADERHRVEVTVSNAGDVAATDAYVEAFWNHPSIGDPAAITRIGGCFVTVPPFDRATAVLPWVPRRDLETDRDVTAHRVLWARVGLFVPPDTSLDRTRLDPRNDRHVALRNVHILVQGTGPTSFSFRVANPSRDRPREFRIEANPSAVDNVVDRVTGATNPTRRRPAEPDRPDDEVISVAVADHRGPAVRPRRARAVRPMAAQRWRPRVGVGQRMTNVALEPGGSEETVVTFDRAPEARRGDVRAFDIRQVDTSDESQVDGMTILVQYR